MREIKEEKVAKVDDGLAAKVRKLEEKIGKMSANWKAFCAKHVGDDVDGKIGSAKAGLLVSIAIVCIATLAVAGVIEKWDENGGTASVTESAGSITIAADVIAPTALSGAVVANANVASDAAIASSKLADDVVRSGDTVSAQLVQSGTIAGDAQTAKTNTFATVFSAAPVVICTFAGDPGDVQPLYVSSVASNVFVVTVPVTNVAVNWVAIGKK